MKHCGREDFEYFCEFRQPTEEQIKLFVTFSVALDESTNISDVAQVAIFIRGVDETLSVTGIPGVGAYDGYHNNQWYFQPSLGC